MSLTPADREMLDQRATLSTRERAVVDSTMRDAAFSARAHLVPLALFDDRTAAFEAACIRYVLTSRDEVKR